MQHRTIINSIILKLVVVLHHHYQKNLQAISRINQIVRGTNTLLTQTTIIIFRLGVPMTGIR